ncbi:MAG: hypothetical protein JNM07_10865 [Phycisphaerae bacterium]|nr:hypothetical protein [Phycisphaerae bacterium]
MLRIIIAVVVGFALWSAVWLGGNTLLFSSASEAVGRGEAVTGAGVLLGILALSVACSAIAGAAAGAIARSMRAVTVLAVLLLAVGVLVQASALHLMPAWYHVVFLGLLIPVTTLAGRAAVPRLAS